MLTYPNIDPVIFRLGPLAVRWYGLMYIIGFLAVHMLVGYQARKYKLTKLAERYEDLNFVLILSLILGARLDDIGLWRVTGRAALYVMTVMAIVSGIDYFRKYLPPLLAKEVGRGPEAAAKLQQIADRKVSMAANLPPRLKRAFEQNAARFRELSRSLVRR